MAPKAVKRSADSQPDSKQVSGPKRRRLISDAIMRAEGLSEQSREMLCAVIPGSLGVKPPQRDVLQTAAVEMLAQALDAREALLKGKVESSAAESASLAEAAGRCAAEAADLEQALAAKSEEVLSKKEALVEDHCALTTCTAQLKGAMDAKAALVTELQDTEQQKENFEKVIAEHLMPLKDAPPTLKRELKKHLAAIEAAVKPLGFDEALTVAIPSSFPKPPEQRGGFDRLVVDHVSEVLAMEVATRSEKLSRSAEATAEVAAAVQAAEVALETAKSRQDASSASLTTGEKEKGDLEVQLKEARSKGRALAEKTEEVAAASGEHQEMLTAFGQVQAMFATERDGEPAKAEAEPAKVEAPPAVDEASLMAGGA